MRVLRKSLPMQKSIEAIRLFRQSRYWSRLGAANGIRPD
jgi:hypothetical protein